MVLNSNGRTLLAVLISFLILPAIAIALLFVARWKRKRAPLVSDYFILAAFAFHIVFDGLCIYGEHLATSLRYSLKLIKS